MEKIHSSTFRPRILIADDHAIFTEALRAYLEKEIYRRWGRSRRSGHGA